MTADAAKGKMPARIFIALGSNLGERSLNLRSALELLGADPEIGIVRFSSFRETPPLGDCDQPAYLNAAAELSTSLTPEELLGRLHGVEGRLGRVRAEKWAPRTIDLDLLLYGDKVIDKPGLRIPHAQMHLRSFVLGPLAEIAPDAVHPVLGRSVSQLEARLGGRDFYTDPSRPQLISVAGVIGVGKTTLAGGLAQELACPMLPEAYDTNPFLARVYAGQHEYALDSQLYFLMSRCDQLSLAAPGAAAVSDYVFDKELIYARRLLDGEQLDLYLKVNRLVSSTVATPVVTVYVYDSLERCMDRIHSRGREYEQRIDREFLSALAADYDKMFADWTASPLLRIDAGRFDCRCAEDVKRLAHEIRQYIAE